MSKNKKNTISLTLCVTYNLKTGTVDIKDMTENNDIGIVLSFTPSCVDERLIKSLDVEDMQYLQDCFDLSLN